MKKLVRLILMSLALSTTAFARLGDTLDQAEARYGLEKKQNPAVAFGKLLDGSREALFEFQGWRIRCALLQATDGNFYVVREEYTKIWNGNVMKAGGSPQIKDFERDAVFKAEGGEWSFKPLAEIGPDVLTTAANQLIRTFGFSKLWIRSDGAVARMNLGEVNVVLDLPQALNYEAQMKGIKDQAQKEQAKRLYQP